MLRFLDMHASRFRQLHLTLPPGFKHSSSAEGTTSLEVVSSWHVHNLEHCMIARSPQRPRNLLQDDSPRRVAVGRFFASGGAKLRSLYLKNLPLLPSDHFPSLTRLVIYTDIRCQLRWEMTDLLRFLSGTPALEFCALPDGIDDHPHEDMDATPMVELSRLRVIALGAVDNRPDPMPYSVVKRLFSRLALPAHCLRCIGSISSAEFPTLFADHMSAASDLAHLHLNVADTKPIGLKYVSHQGLAGLTCSIHYPRGHARPFGWLEDVLKDPSVALAVHGLSVDGSSVARGIDLVCNLLPLLPNLRRLALSSFLQFEEIDYGPLLGLLGFTEHLPCPALESLSLFLDQTCARPGTTDRLLAMVEARAARGRPIRDLLLGHVSCPPSEAFVDAVTAHGARVACVDTMSPVGGVAWVLRGPEAHHVPDVVDTEWSMLRQRD
ncbi:hypothetical protein C8Q76DRAFT_264808 [Earliella scabrosa]|nr:hypothetical protein C8Q76DRAFT_264808 [Earliella scabrosa]